MSDNLKKQIKDFADIAKSCPENLQEICFELLLKDYLDGAKRPSSQKEKSNGHGTEANDKSGIDTKDEQDVSQEDFKTSDLHVKARKFLTDQNLTIDHINQIFYKEGEKVEPLFDDLKTTKSAESQVRISLLQALKKSIHSGEFTFNGEDVRAETKLRKCHDSVNFTAIFKNNKTLFEKFEKYNKKSPNISLSKAGKESLAEVIKDLQ